MNALTKPHGSCRGPSGSDMHTQTQPNWKQKRNKTAKQKCRRRKEGFPITRTRGLVAYWRGPISEDAMRLLGREQPASRGSSGTCGVMANHTKSITRTLPAPKVCGDTGIRTTDHTGRRLLARV